VATGETSAGGIDPAAAGAYCRGCGYALRGLGGGRCPECGRAFDLADRRSFARRPPRSRLRRWAWRVGLALAAVALAVGSVPAWYWWQWRAEQGVIAEIRGMGGRVAERRSDAAGLARYLPARWAFLRDHASNVRLGDLTAAQVERLDLRPLRHVEELSVYGCGVSDAALGRFGGFGALEVLELTGNPVNGSVLAPLARGGRLKILDVRRTRLNDAGLAHVGRLTSLTWLVIAETDVTDAGMAHLAGLTSLVRLDLSATAVTDAGLLRLRGLTSLEEITVSGSKATWQGTLRLQKLLPKMTFCY
jgi:Zn-dependent protease